MVSFILRLFAPWVGWVVQLVAGMWDWLHDRSVHFLSVLADYLKDLLPSYISSWMNQINGMWPTVAAYWVKLTYFFPLQGVISLVLTTVTTCALIRLARWIKSFVPTVSG